MLLCQSDSVSRGPAALRCSQHKHYYAAVPVRQCLAWSEVLAAQPLLCCCASQTVSRVARQHHATAALRCLQHKHYCAAVPVRQCLAWPGSTEAAHSTSTIVPQHKHYCAAVPVRQCLAWHGSTEAARSTSTIVLLCQSDNVSRGLAALRLLAAQALLCCCASQTVSRVAWQH